MALKDLAKFIHEVAKEKTPEEEVLYFYNGTIKQLQKPRTPSTYYSPSSMNCQRNCYYKRIGTPVEFVPMQPQLVDICKSGENRHLDIQNIFMYMNKFGYDIKWLDVAEYLKEKHGKEFNKLYQVSKDGNETLVTDLSRMIRFKCDGLLQWGKIKYILEIKTEMAVKHQVRFFPAPEHEQQAKSYCLSLGLTDVIFLYENRDKCNKKIFIESYKQDEVNQVDEFIREVERCIESKELPDKNEKVCTYCNYVKLCKTNSIHS